MDDMLNRPVILVVDDEPQNISILGEVLRTDYIVRAATSGQKALEMVMSSDKPPDLILLDVMMPGMDGYSVCGMLKADERFCGIPVIFVTAKSSEADEVKGFEYGAVDYVTKPFSPVVVRARVRTHIELKKYRDSREVDFLLSQIKPHFFYNVLNTIVSLCYTDSRKAGKLLTEFSNYLRRSFDVQGNQLFISLENEMQLVRSYVAIEQARFGERLKVTYHIDKNLLLYRIPPLVILPLVENAVIHGLMKREEGGHIVVTVRQKERKLIIEVADNGIGISADQLAELLSNKQESGGVGLRNVNRRLGKYYGEELSIVSEGQGTVASLRIPTSCLQVFKRV